jgi:hypothetical protein
MFGNILVFESSPKNRELELRLRLTRRPQGGIDYAKKKNNEGREDGTFRSMEDLWPLVA